MRQLKVSFIKHLHALGTRIRTTHEHYFNSTVIQQIMSTQLAPDVRVESKAAKSAGAVALGQTARIDYQRTAKHAMSITKTGN